MFKKFLIFFNFIVFLFSLVLIKPPEIFAQSEVFQDEVFEGKVIQITDQKTVQIETQSQIYQKLIIKITSGNSKGSEITIENGLLPAVNPQTYKIGDKVVVAKSISPEGEINYFITDKVRRSGLLFLFIIFVAMVILVGGTWGARSLAGMAFSFLIIFYYILPQILKGNDPVLTAIIGSVFIIPVTFYFSHGFNSKTHIAVVSTLATLVFTGFMASLFVDLTGLTGYSSEEAGFLEALVGNKVNMKGLLLAGIIIASLGVLDDITISQASIVRELKNANSKLNFKQLFLRAMKVGRDHISSLVNTLILVYAGASLPLLLLFINNPLPFAQIINMEIIADEIVRTLVGSIGLIFTVPITTLLASFFTVEDIHS